MTLLRFNKRRVRRPAFALGGARATLRLLAMGGLATLAAGPAQAGTPDRDKAWDALIAEAKKHGGAETQYKTSTSLVFQHRNGFFITITELTDGKTRAVCAMSKDQIVVTCGNWDTGAIRYGWRADAGSAWTYSDSPPKAKDAETSPFASLLSGLSSIMEMGSKLKMERVP